MVDEPGTRTLAEFHFQSVMNHRHVAALEATGLRIRGVHDPDRRMPGTGFLGDARAVMLALTRDGDGYRLVALTHQSDGWDGSALSTWAESIRALLPDVATHWSEATPRT